MLARPEPDSNPPKNCPRHAPNHLHAHTCSGQPVHGVANLASLAREAVFPARAGQIEGQDLPPGISAVESQLLFWTSSLLCGWRLVW